MYSESRLAKFQRMRIPSFLKERFFDYEWTEKLNIWYSVFVIPVLVDFYFYFFPDSFRIKKCIGNIREDFYKFL